MSGLIALGQVRLGKLCVGRSGKGNVKRLQGCCRWLAGLTDISGDLSSNAALPNSAVGLDTQLMSQDAICACLHSCSQDADISIIEGYGGLFDSPSADGTEKGSTAQIAHWLQAPVVLVIDAHAVNSVKGIMALLKGYTAVDNSGSVAAVILNKAATGVLAADLQEGLKNAAMDVTVLGWLPKVHDRSSNGGSALRAAGHLQSPCSAASTPRSCCTSNNRMVQLADTELLSLLVPQHIDLQQLQELAAKAAVLQPQAPLPAPVRTYRVSMAVAHDEAFHQYFQQNLHMLQCAGVQLVPFSPLHDARLPPGVSALLLGGGALADCSQQLAANTPMLEAIRAFAAAGGLVVGEGSAVMYLSQSAQLSREYRHAMVGLFPFHTQAMVQAPDNRHHYVTVTVQQQHTHPLLLPGSKLKGIASCCCQVVEERLVGGLAAALAATRSAPEAAEVGKENSTGQLPDPSAESQGASAAAMPGSAGPTAPVTHSYSCQPVMQLGSDAAIDEGYTRGTALASCVHLHYGSCPEVVQHMAQRCLRVDVASATIAASTAADTALAAAAAAAVTSPAHSAATLDLGQHPSPLVLPKGPSSGPSGPETNPTHHRGIKTSRVGSAPDLHHMQLFQQHQAALDASTGAAAGAAAFQGGPVGTHQGSLELTLASKKSASIPANMYQLGGPDHSQQQPSVWQWQHMPRYSVPGNSEQHQHQPQQHQQHGQHGGHHWNPILFHVPKRWSLELQRLGSITSQLLPGNKSPTAAQQRQVQQHTHHLRSDSHTMVELPEEAPLSDAAIKLLDRSLPTVHGRTQHTRMGLAVRLSNGDAAASAADATNRSLGVSLAQQQQAKQGSASVASSVHEQMILLAASLAQQEVEAGTQAAEAASLCDANATDGQGWDKQGLPISQGGMPAAIPSHITDWMPRAGSADGLPPLAPGYMQQRQRQSFDQHNLYVQQQQQWQGRPPNAHGLSRSKDSRGSLDSLYPGAYKLRQLQKAATDQQGVMQNSAGNFKGAAVNNAIDGMPHSSSTSKLTGMVPSAAASRMLSQGSGPSIISLSPAATDCMVALGLAGRLAGVTDACTVVRPGAASEQGSSIIGQLLAGLDVPWAAQATEAAADKSDSHADVPVLCRLVEGPDGLPRYKLDEDTIRRVQPGLVVVACEENSSDEPHVQHYQQLQMRHHAGRTSRKATSSQTGTNTAGSAAAASWAWAHSPAGQVSSSMSNSVAMPGRVRLEVSVVQRVLQRAGVLWPEQRAIVLFQRCHSMAEVLEFIIVLADAAGVPDRGIVLVEALRKRLRSVVSRLRTFSSMQHTALDSIVDKNSSRTSSGSLAGSQFTTAGRCASVASQQGDVAPVVVVLEGTNPLRVSGFWVPEMLQLVGASQMAPCLGPAEPPASVPWVQMRVVAPAVLVLAVPGLDAGQAAVHTADLASLPGFWSLPAVSAGAVYAADHRLFCRPGPGLLLGVELLGHLLAPDRQPLPAGLPLGSVLKLALHGGQRCRPRLVPTYMSLYC
eukprot:GHRR01006507.1.p1 GENE.GHRR01006507.1~~GHRR01006507.1.p1  ORF type:complete len:1538 (+),score=611.00 GHRR01006507.1:116-4615(+)